MQNTSHAVKAQRSEPRDSLDDFPTPPWATRALLKHVIKDDVSGLSCLEPACGAGHMSRTLNEYFESVKSSDVAYYGFGELANFLEYGEEEKYDWVITNPPFKLAEEFIQKALRISKIGAAFLTRTTFIESVGRYQRLFNSNPPAKFAQFVERVPMVKGRLDAKASTATGYCWLVWQHPRPEQPEITWIPPCRRALEFPTDYALGQLSLI